MTATFNFQGYEIPADIARLCAINSQNFGDGSSHLSYIDGVVGIRKEHHILEVGCALGRIAIPLTKRLDPNACFKGVDIVRPAIEWCNDNISSLHPNFQFSHFDVQDDHHNPAGTLKTNSITLPTTDGSIDRIIAWCVFSHLFADDIEHYLREFSRVLTPDGLAIISCHLVNDDLLAQFKNDERDLTFEHEYSDGCYINCPDHPWLEVAYTDNKMEEMASLSGLTYDRPLLPGPSRRTANVRNFLHCGLEQDVVVLKRTDRGNTNSSLSR